MNIGESGILTFNIGVIIICELQIKTKLIKMKSPPLCLAFLNECIFIFHIITQGPGQHVKSNPQIYKTNVPLPALICKFAHTFLLGECITGAGGDGGPLGIFLFVLDVQK